MFNRCQKWRARMDLLTDGELSPERRAALQTHLGRCAACQSLFAADAARRDALSRHDGMLTAPQADAFDAGILAALRVPAAPEPLTLRSGPRALLRNLPTDFLQQLAGGAMAAAALTVVCLFTALHPKISNAPRRAASPQPTQNETPVALEELLRAHSPRAYSLWSVPPAGAPRPTHTAPPVRRARPKNSGRQGAIFPASRLS